MTNNAQEELAEVIGFEIDEVKTNAAGKLSKRQISRLRVMSLIMFLFVVAFVCIIRNAYHIANLPQCYDQCDTMQFLRGWLALSAAAIYLFISLRSGLWLPKVQTTTGKIQIHGGMRLTTKVYKVVVGETKLSHGWATWSLFLPKSEYNGEVQAYYLEIIPCVFKPVLSVEPIEN